MEIFDLQTTLTVMVILAATAVVVFFDYLRKHRQPVHASQQPQKNKTVKSPRPQQSIRIFEHTPIDYAAAKKLATERPLEPLVAIATLSRPPVEHRIQTETVTVQMTPPSLPASSTSTETQPSATSLPEFALPPITIDAALWERLISSQPKQNLLSSADADPEPHAELHPELHPEPHPEPHPERMVERPPSLSSANTLGSANTIEASYQMMQDSAPTPSSDIQLSGMIQQPLLEKWLESEQRFTGLVISIGVNDSDSSMWHSRGLMQSVGSYIAGLLRAKDYCCRTAYDEFLMVCPGEQGAHSQRHLNHISERLWDYQLRGIGTCSILFSWGGVQVQNQPLADAIASATERMRETKRNSHSKSAEAHRQAV
jgi:hypothetical protein